MYHHSLRQPAQSRNRAQAGVCIDRHSGRPCIRRRFPDGWLCQSRYSWCPQDLVGLGLLTVCFLSQSGTYHLNTNISLSERPLLPYVMTTYSICKELLLSTHAQLSMLWFPRFPHHLTAVYRNHYRLHVFYIFGFLPLFISPKCQFYCGRASILYLLISYKKTSLPK